MASRHRSLSKPAVNLLKSTIFPKPTAKIPPSLRISSSSPSFHRSLATLGARQSLLPLHSAVSSGRLTSCIGIDPTSSRSLSQGPLQSSVQCMCMPGFRTRSPLFDYRHQTFCTTAADDKKMINVTFVDKDGEEQQIKVPVGMSMLEAAHENDIELEGACEASLACSTCHVIVMDVDYYNKLDDPSDEENDMLDLAFGLTETSRLGCQVVAAPELDGIRLALPSATRNFAVDGFKPKPH